MRGRDLPVGVPALIGGLALAGLVTGLASGLSQPVVAWWVLLPLLAALVMGGQLQIHFQYRGHVEAMDLFEAALLPVVLIFPGAGAVLLAALAKAVSQRMMRVAPVKAAFNVAQWAAAAGVASLVYVSLGGGHLGGSARTGAVVAGMVAGMLVNHLSVALVIALAQRLSLRTALGDLAPIIVPIWMIGGVVNLSLGVLIATLVRSQPVLAPLALVPLGSLHWAQRAFAEARADHARVEALHQATQALAEPVDPFEALPQFVEVVRDCFEAAAADLVMLDDAGKTFHAGESGTEDLSRELAGQLWRSAAPLRVSAGDGSPAGGLLAKAGRRNCLAAALHGDERIRGLLVSYDRAGLEGFEAGEMAVFGALAGEVSNALQKSVLLSTLLNERPTSSTSSTARRTASSPSGLTACWRLGIRPWRPSPASPPRSWPGDRWPCSSPSGRTAGSSSSSVGAIAEPRSCPAISRSVPGPGHSAGCHVRMPPRRLAEKRQRPWSSWPGM